MPAILVDSYCLPFQKALSANYSTNGYPTKAATGTAPSAIQVSGYPEAQAGRSSAVIVPYGTGADDATFNMRVLGWKVLGNTPSSLIWIPVNLVEIQCTLGTSVGVAGLGIVATERFVDTIAIVTGNANVSVDINSPADNTIAHIVLGLKSSLYMECIFTTGGSATDCNALVSLK